jgi:hypothetical protein
MGERRTIEKVNGGDNSINLKNIDPYRKAIHIHGGMEHNLVGYAKYYSYGNTKISKNREFTKEIDHSRRKFSKH